MLDTKESILTLDEMRRKRGTSGAVFKKFTEARIFFNSHAFCFYEGEDGKYYNPRVFHYFGNKFISLVAGNKKEVLRVMEKIQSDSLYDDVCVMFFIDRDYDLTLAGSNKDLYETPCYSVENLYAQEDVLCKILQSEFGLNISDSDYSRCLADYKARLIEFNQIILYFNSLVKYQHQYAPNIKARFSNIKTSSFARITLERVTKAKRFSEQIESLKALLNVDTQLLDSISEELRIETNPSYVFRGKNQLDFFVAIVKLFKDMNSSGQYFSQKLNNVHINLSSNRLSELSQYAITPNELNTFLEEHQQKMSS